jgi:hypothetical protein
MMMSSHETPDNLHDRLLMLDRRIERMRSLNSNHGDLMALRLIEHAQIERRQILAEISADNRKAR